MITLCINHSFAYEMECVLRIFYPGEKIVIEREHREAEGNVVIATVDNMPPDEIRLTARLRIDNEELRECVCVSAASDDVQERALGRLLFGLLCKKTGRTPPWGILTGIRPVRLYNQLREKGMSDTDANAVLLNDYLVQPEKIKLVSETAHFEQAVLDRRLADGFSLYIGIPFCPSRCLYCSFVSHEIEKAAKLVPDYVECLKRELIQIAEIAKGLGLRMQSIYVGGGTPTTMTTEQLKDIFSVISDRFENRDLMEFTVEAGRPDTIDWDKLQIMKAFGVDRISVNPQTMNDQILDIIGRKHTATQIVESYRMVREVGFKAVNMDLIAGLPGESAESFDSTVRQVLALEPENITVHSLTVKRASHLREREDAFDERPLDVSALLDGSRKALVSSGYFPYYLYRQKGTVQNLENVGYSKPGYEGIYNVLIMEEIHTVLAAGAGATTKLYAPPNELTRVFNYKYPYEYISRFDQMASRKAAIKEFYEKHQ